MTPTKVSKGQSIFSIGQYKDGIFLIVQGSVHVSYPGGSYDLGKGDICGIMEYCYDSFFMNYTATEDTIIYPYSLTSEGFQASIKKNPELSNILLSTALKQIGELIDQYDILSFESDSLYSSLNENYEKYSEFCGEAGISPRALPGIEELVPLSLEADLPTWLSGYYREMHSLIKSSPNAISDYSDFLQGLLYKCSKDSHMLLGLSQEVSDYMDNLSSLLINESRMDFFDLYTALIYQTAPGALRATLMSYISTIMLQIESRNSLEKFVVEERFNEYRSELEALENAPLREPVPALTNDKLNDSLNQILDYAECLPDLRNEFTALLNKYIALPDKNSSEPEVGALRKKLGAKFFELYTAVFQASLMDRDLPIIIKMFLLFGYVDEHLAGAQNATILYDLARDYRKTEGSRIYTLYDWLLAIYKGQKEPSRNEFDNDYPAYLRELKQNGKITPQEEAAMLKNPAHKVMFELENMVPTVSKITYGRVTTYCPVFSEHDVIKPLESVYVKEKDIISILNEIRAADYSVFYRETVYTNPQIGITKENIHVEILPDVILMPNIGVRGSMWQEIEGMRRTTPARMMISIFELEDMRNLLIRLTGEFRWEMCKRVQGAHWNDVTDRSLTSEYFDYIQFYKKNHDLSTDAKDKIKTALGKSKNSFKEVFVKDYITWIQFEAKGSPRMNKVARTIFFTYCPFPADIRAQVGANPMYGDLIHLHDIKSKQKQHTLNNLFVKITNSGKPVPRELQMQMAYLQR